MSDSLVLTDEFVASTLANVPGWKSGTAPIEILTLMVRRSLFGHIIVAPTLAIHEVRELVAAAVQEAVLLDSGELAIQGRVAGIWRPFVFESFETDTDVNAIALFQWAAGAAHDRQFVERMDYLRLAARSVTLPLHYMEAALAFADDNDTIIGIELTPNLVGAGIIAMEFLPTDPST
jgi:hypothetical protein